jgi:hypothetical protein
MGADLGDRVGFTITALATGLAGTVLGSAWAPCGRQHQRLLAGLGGPNLAGRAVFAPVPDRAAAPAPDIRLLTEFYLKRSPSP